VHIELALEAHATMPASLQLLSTFRLKRGAVKHWLLVSFHSRLRMFSLFQRCLQHILKCQKKCRIVYYNLWTQQTCFTKTNFSWLCENNLFLK
jgi:hypothetical protein